MENVTTVNEFLLLFDLHSELQPVLFMTLLIIYMIDLFGNGSISGCHLGAKTLLPMYFFLGNFSCLDICYSSVTLPILMANLPLCSQGHIFPGLHHSATFLPLLSGCTESILLAMMGFDRFVAICYPLRYTVIMNFKACILLATVAWITSFFYALMHSVMTARLNFCHSETPQLLLLRCEALLGVGLWWHSAQSVAHFYCHCSLAMAACFLLPLSPTCILSASFCSRTDLPWAPQGSVHMCLPFHGGISVLWNCILTSPLPLPHLYHRTVCGCHTHHRHFTAESLDIHP